MIRLPALPLALIWLPLVDSVPLILTVVADVTVMASAQLSERDGQVTVLPEAEQPGGNGPPGSV